MAMAAAYELYLKLKSLLRKQIKASPSVLSPVARRYPSAIVAGRFLASYLPGTCNAGACLF
jgi:hypothetical protein